MVSAKLMGDSPENSRAIFIRGGEPWLMGYSTENSLPIFIRGGEPWLMNYCWRTQKCRNLCIPHAFLEGKTAEDPLREMLRKMAASHALAVTM
jgi:hypothetical protein